MVYYAVDTYYTEEILDNMHSIGCDGDMLRTAYENISSGNLNTGVTYSNFGTRETVKEAMKLRNVKSKDLAEYVEVTKSTMSLFLNGKTNLGQEKIEKILDFLDIKLVITK